MSSKITVKHFSNKCINLTPDITQALMTSNGQLSQKSSVVASLAERWTNVQKKFDELDFRDYSTYTGTSGIALLKLKKSGFETNNTKEVLALLPISHLKGRRISFLCGDAGPLAIGAIAYHKCGEKDNFKRCLTKLLAMQNEVVDINSDTPDEILYGRAGYLYALLYVNKHIHPSPIADAIIRKVIEAILISGENLAKTGKFRCPLMYQWHESYYLGAAHGVSGILYMLLQAKQYLSENELHTLIKPTIEYLASLRFHSGNFPSSLGSENDKLVQWCHGAPGFVFLFSMAYKVYGDQRYLNLALECGDVVWERGLLRKGYSLCHGVSGNAYCFLELFQTTKDVKHLYRAVKFAEWCVDYTRSHEEHYPDRPLSLFEGTAGPMYLLLDIQKPFEAKFPGFTL